MSGFDNYLEDPCTGQLATLRTLVGIVNAAFLKAVDPIVKKGIKMYGDDNPLASNFLLDIYSEFVALTSVRSMSSLLSKSLSSVTRPYWYSWCRRFMALSTGAIAR